VERPDIDEDDGPRRSVDFGELGVGVDGCDALEFGASDGEDLADPEGGRRGREGVDGVERGFADDVPEGFFVERGEAEVLDEEEVAVGCAG